MRGNKNKNEADMDEKQTNKLNKKRVLDTYRSFGLVGNLDLPPPDAVKNPPKAVGSVVVALRDRVVRKSIHLSKLHNPSCRATTGAVAKRDSNVTSSIAVGSWHCQIGNFRCSF